MNELDTDLIECDDDITRVIRASHLQFCEGDACSAALIDTFAEQHSKLWDTYVANAQPNATTVPKAALYQYHTLNELHEAIVTMFSQPTICRALEYLASVKNIIQIQHYPNEENASYCLLFYPHVFNEWIVQQPQWQIS